MAFSVPILILSFNRPLLVERQIKLLQDLHPKELYIFSDGPRKDVSSDLEKVNDCRKLFKEYITWECKTKFKFEKKNKGCGLGVSTAISWFFSNVEEGIIIEDDCMIDKSFFPFAKEMLFLYKDDLNIAGITADYKIGSSKTNNYGFIPFSLIWGWATWKRSWEGYSFKLENFKDGEIPKIIKNMPKNQQKFWIENFEKIVSNKIPHTWDFQFSYLVMLRDQKFIYPHTNLITNLGFTIDATHTKNPFDENACLKTGKIFSPYQLDIASTKYAEFLAENCFTYKSKFRKIFYYLKSIIISFIKYLNQRLFKFK